MPSSKRLRFGPLSMMRADGEAIGKLDNLTGLEARRFKLDGHSFACLFELDVSMQLGGVLVVSTGPKLGAC